MLRTGIALAVLAGTVGCQHMHAQKAAGPPGEPGTTDSQSVCLPPPRIEVQGSSETVVVKAPAAAAGLVCPPSSGVTPEQLQEFTRKIAELEEQLKAARVAAEKK